MKWARHSTNYFLTNGIMLLIRIVNDALSADRKGRFDRKVYFPYLHPHGIKEMTETKGLRSAYAVAQLLSSLEVGGVDDRINALRSLRLK